MLLQHPFPRLALVELSEAPEPESASARNARLDRAALTYVLTRALDERKRGGGSVARRVGLGGMVLEVALRLCVPGVRDLEPEDYECEDESEEQDWIRNLLLRHVSTDLEVSNWFAAIVARRALEANHLWEDLGLPERPALTALMLRHFRPLAERNVHNMRWKRFFYRTLCEEEGLVHCTSPTCSTCPEVDKCFAESPAEAMIARNKQAPGHR